MNKLKKRIFILVLLLITALPLAQTVVKKAGEAAAMSGNISPGEEADISIFFIGEVQGYYETCG